MDPVSLSEVMMSIQQDTATETNEADASVATVRLLSYNVFSRPPGIKNNSDDYKDERLNEIMTDEVVGQFDVVAFQELFAFGSSRQTRVLEKARQLGFYHCVTSPKPSLLRGRVIDSGLALLSRYPIEESDSITFSTGSGVDGWCAKGVLYARIRTSAAIDENVDEQEGEGKKQKKQKNTFLHVFTTHTQASYNTHLEHSNPEINRANDRARSKQFEELGAFIGSKMKSDETRSPAVLMGDLNVDARHYHPVFSHHKTTPGDNKGLNSEPYKVMVETIKTSCSKVMKPATNPFNQEQPQSFQSGVHWRDLFFEVLHEHPITVGDLELLENGEYKPLEIQLTSKNDLGLCKCLDYIFLIEYDVPHLNERSQPPVQTIEPVQDSVIVKRYFVQGKPYSQLSDHYGVAATLKHTISW